MTTTTHHGYLIRELIADNGYSISKGGAHICYADSEAEARRVIDESLYADECEAAYARSGNC